MVRPEYSILGYVRIKVEEKDLARLLSFFLRLGISSYPEGADYIIHSYDLPRFRKYADGRIRYTADASDGLFPRAFNIRNIPLFFFFLLFLLLTFLSSDLIYEIRVAGVENMSESEVIDKLSLVGFSVGKSWSSIDKENIEVAFLSLSDEIAWISINKQGTVATVELREKKALADEDTGEFCVSDIVAENDGVVEEITVREGKALVKVGDTVKKGDVLISGIIETEYATVLTRARGEVKVALTEKYSIKVPFTEEKIIENPSHVCAVILRVLNFDINIYKNYGNFKDGYGIIKETNTLTLPKDRRFPISLTTERVTVPEGYTVSYTVNEAVALAKERLNDSIRRDYPDSDILRILTNGQVSDDAYTLDATVVYLKSIGREVFIDISD